MKRSMRKLVLILLVVALFITLIACGDGGTSGDQSGGDKASVDQSGDVDLEDDLKGRDPVTLTFMGWEASPLETEAVKDGIAEFEKQFDHIKIDYTATLSGSEYTAKLLSSHAGGSMPDVMFVQSADYRTFAPKGVILDVTDRFGGDYTLDDFLPSVQELMTLDDGKVYGIQSCIVTPVLYYNKDIFDQAGMDYPGTSGIHWDDFRQMAIDLTTDDIFGVYGTETTNMVINALLASNETGFYKDDYKKSAINTPEAKEVFEKIRSLRYDDKAALDATTLENIGMSANQMLQTGKVAMVLDGSWALQELAKMDFNIGVAPIPYFKKSANTAQAHLHSIAADSKHHDEAWEFLKFLSGMDYQGELVAQGLWMPNRKSMYEPDVVEQWYSDEVHGEYKEFLDYFIDAIVDAGAMQRSNKCGDIINEETDKFYKDGGELETMIENIENRTNEALLEAKDD